MRAGSPVLPTPGPCDFLEGLDWEASPRAMAPISVLAVPLLGSLDTPLPWRCGWLLAASDGPGCVLPSSEPLDKALSPPGPQWHHLENAMLVGPH